MFLIFNKDKIVSYLISISTVAFLFMLSFILTKSNEAILTSYNVVNITNHIENKEIHDNELNFNRE